MVTDREPDNLFIATSSSTVSNVIMSNVYDALVIYDEATDEMHANIAEAWELNEVLEYTFTM